MAGKKSNRKITKYRRYSVINIGTILFGIIFIYMIACIFLYATTEHVTSYEVISGSISGNYRYRALALKTEAVVTAPQSGKVTYYAREGAKASAGSTVCSINEAGVDASALGNLELDAEDYSNLKNTMSSFALNFDDSSFQNVYDFKADLESYILQQSQTSTGTAIGMNQCTAPASGFVVYAVDSLENLTEQEITPELFDQNSYEKTNLRFNGTATAGSPLFKMVTDENWALYFPLDTSLATELMDRSSIRFRFLKDDNTFTAKFSIIQNDGNYFGKIALNNSLIRYVSDRYLEIELLLSRKEGLKIPTSAIAEKEFYKIPKEYVTDNSGTQKEVAILRETFNNDGSSSVKNVIATVYGRTEDSILVSTDLFQPGDYVLMQDTNKKYQIQENNVETIQGVYNINKGYAVFREVTVIDENEEFCIVESNNVYGLDTHDFIAMDAATVDNDDIIS